ncbi:hypothetical protein NC653_010164 [Populus alba x Populus x berolinensis]|uniref:Uncharacterized protein n=1 Tax=Populus alba x Populus x berolinensis TaxID=444605 RepID=A0AAD6QZ56_9ROSI|nr:hypothetical protein NC653_010164 [Populus alba x Populus x berolinensis]
MGGLGKEGGKRVLMLEAIQDLYLFNHRSIILKSPLSSPWKKTFSRKVIFILLREGEFVEEEAPSDGVFFGFSSYFQLSTFCWILDISQGAKRKIDLDGGFLLHLHHTMYFLWRSYSLFYHSR